MTDVDVLISPVKIEIYDSKLRRNWPHKFKPGTRRMKVIEAMHLIDHSRTFAKRRPGRYQGWNKNKVRRCLCGKTLRCARCRSCTVETVRARDKWILKCHDCGKVSEKALTHWGSTIDWQETAIEDLPELTGRKY